MTEKPLIGVIGCNRMVEDEPSQVVRTRYISALSEEAGGVPLIVPSLGRAEDAALVASRVDALLLTGSATNIEPRAYGAATSRDPFDPMRDRTAFSLIRAARHFSVPVFGICRGLQEINVALGGTLSDERDAGTSLHHAPDTADLDETFAFSHAITPAPASFYARLAGPDPVMVNSVHYQRIDRLGEGLRVEATAEDGTIEAIASREAEPLVFAVQWHPEWHPAERRHDVGFWRWIGEAARQSARRRAEGLSAGLF